jgi:serine/threonine-protein kinase
MSLNTGARIGPYVVESAIGAGGMGEVYRARDSKLNRDVAIKVLPDLLATDPERLARFTREAQTLAALNHPNIAHVHGLEQLPNHASALVMELVEGQDLSEIIARGPIPIADALPIARQIADGLEAAHEQGIVHRDLKPANVKVRADGTVKVLDFGLAMGAPAGDPAIANSPTFTSPLMLTQMGVLLGTAAYMAPEQARGKTVDKRADIWAFGCVLYEMLSGRKAFDGESIADVLGAIVSRDPDWTCLPAGLPSRVRDVLGWCLARNPAERLKDLGDVRVLLADAMTGPREPGTAAPPTRSGLIRAVTLAGWTIAAGLAAMFVWQRLHAPAAAVPRTMRLELPLIPPVESMQQQFSSSFALSSDGARLVYVARQGNSTALFLRDLETGAVRSLPDTTDGYAPFFSPDATSVVFTSSGRLRTIQLSAPLSRDLTGVVPGGNMRITADWGPSGEVVFTDPRGLARVGSDGGNAEIIAPLLPAESGFDTPRMLPDGRHVLVAVRSKDATRTDDVSRIAVVDPGTGEHHVLIDQGGSPALLHSGSDDRSSAFLIYALGGRLWAARFDLTRLAVVGSPQPVVDNVDMRPNGDGAQFAVSADGTLAYLEASQTQLVWVDRSGAATPASAALRRFALPRLSPDERTLAVEVQDTPHQTWQVDLARDLLTPITQWKDGSHNFAWSRDGRAIAFTASVGGATNVMWMPADGSLAPQLLLSADKGGNPWAERWSPDGRSLAILDRGGNSTELQVLPLEPGSPPKVAGPVRTIMRLARANVSLDFSPDGQWIAYCDCGTGQRDSTIFISRLADGRRYRVAVDGVSEVKWSASGREVFFRQGTSMMAADVTIGADVRIGRPHKLFEGNFLEWGAANYDVARDGRFVMVRPASASASGRALSIRLHWVEELKKINF